MAPTLTQEQHQMMAITERIISGISIIGILFIILTYMFSSAFSKPINRLVFYASWGNLGLCIVAMISMDGPDAGQKSALCQFQGFMAQLFLGVDAYWAFCMAVNIYLVFFRGYSTKQLRGLDHKYFIACYGLSLIPAVAYLFVATEERGKVYGGAVLWCWVSNDWAFLRIAVLYVFMWVAVLIAIVIYIMAGRYVWKKRGALNGFLNPFNEDPFNHEVVMTTEVTISSQERKPSQPNLEVREIDKSHEDGNYDAYSVNIEIGQLQRPERPQKPARPALFNLPSFTRAVALSEENVDAFLYARVAFLFFIALLITWVPSSGNRASALAHPETINFGLNFASAIVFSSQGLLNCLVYMATSKSACRMLWAKLLGREYKPNPTKKESFTTFTRGRRGGDKDGIQRHDSDTTSMTNLTAR
ncbi:MAG: hypothetical protein L6R37_007568 [Teloschistes peruensis]|nr:MAG: hypothetical protein L6R37_007568 [Teloschistes peruensis]